MKPLSVVLADDHPAIRSGIVSILEAEAEICVVAEASTGQKTIEICASRQPDVLLLDLSMPGPDPVDVIQAVHAAAAKTNILVLTLHDDSASIRSVMRAGITGYLLKEDAVDMLVTAVHTASKGESWYSPAIAQELVRWGFSTDAVPEAIYPASIEKELLTYVARENNTALAETVEAHTQITGKSNLKT